MSALATAMSYADLERMGEQALPYLYQEIFSTDGWRARALSKKRFRLLKNLDQLLQGILSDGERVYFASWGIDYSFWEHYFLGLWSYFINRRALIVTDGRLLLLQVDHKHRPLALKAQVEYAAIAKLPKSAFGYLALKLRDGKSVTLTGLPGKDRKRVRQLIERFRAQPRAASSGRVGKQNLCPHCCQTVAGRPEACPHCRRAFRSARKAAWLSFAFPGVGDLYLGLRLLGAVEILGAALVWGAVAMGVLGAQEGEAFGAPELAFLATCLVVFVHGPDALVTRHTARKGLYPDGS